MSSQPDPLPMMRSEPGPAQAYDVEPDSIASVEAPGGSTEAPNPIREAIAQAIEEHRVILFM